MAPKKIILLACGSFNPPTFMHLRMFEVARDFLQRNGNYQVVCGIISPVHDSYKKNDLISSTHRCALVKLALKDSDWIYLSDWESNRLDYTPTRLVLQYHQNQVTAALNQEETNNKQAEWTTHVVENASSSPVSVSLLCGGDLLESMGIPGIWNDTDISTILKDHGLVVITRNGTNPYKFIYESDIFFQYQSNINIVTEWIPNEVSSTRIRRSLRRGESVKYLLSNDVINYIKTHGLFGSNANNWINEVSPDERVSPNDVIMSSLRGDPSDSGNYPQSVDAPEEDESRVQIQICEDGTIRVVSDRETTIMRLACRK